MTFPILGYFETKPWYDEYPFIIFYVFNFSNFEYEWFEIFDMTVYVENALFDSIRKKK